MRNKLFFSILGVLVICGLTFGVTYAYYQASTNTSFEGEGATGISTTLTLTTTYKASKLVPLNNALVKTAITKETNKCIDKDNYEVCSLYKITLKNTNNSEDLQGYIRTTESTYTTDNLKYQIYDSNYSVLTDVMTLSKTANETTYFKYNNNDYTVTSTGTTTYYLVIWLTDTGSEQSADYSKRFSGVVGFESTSNSGFEKGRIEATF